MDETSLGGSRRYFRSTMWTQVLAAKDPASPTRRAALEELIKVYWKPVYGFLRRKERSIEEAKDLTQGFFAAFLERDYLRYVERGRGKFRTFLLTALQHWVADQYDRRKAQKRGGGIHLRSLDVLEAEREMPISGGPEDTPDTVYRRQWALLVLERALHRVRTELDGAGRLAEFDMFRDHLREAPAYVEVAERLGITIGDVRNRIHRTKKRYREAILEEIRSYAESEEEARQELQELFAAFTPSFR